MNTVFFPSQSFYVAGSCSLLILVGRLIHGRFDPERLDAQMAAPVGLGRCLKRWFQAIEVEAAVTVVAKQQLIVVLRGATNGATLALDALPTISLGGDMHILGKLQTTGMP